MSATTNELARELEEMEDQRDALDAMLAIMMRANEECVPLAMVRRLSDGEHPVRVWREYRSMSLDELASAAGMTPQALDAIESGRTDPTVRILVPIARALRVELEDLVPPSRD